MTLLSELRKNQDAAIGADGLDSAEVTTIAQSAGLAVYTALDSLPSTNLTSGDQAWVESSGRLYISNGSGWYNIALINASPTLTLDQSGTIQLNADTLTVTVTASATDSDDNSDMITFSVESDGNMVGTGTTISQDSSVFTITADSEGGNGVAGNFTLTFKATDGIAVDNEDLSFSLSFVTIVDSSAETILLMKADGNNEVNAAITYQNSSDVSTGFTEAGTVGPQASTFTPYRSGGYSGYFDDTTYTTDWIEVDHDAGLSVGSSNFTIEGWFYANSLTNNDAIFGKWHQGSIAGRNEWLIYVTGGQPKFLYSTDGSSGAPIVGMGTYSLKTWHHFAVVRNGSTITTYLDGTSQDTGNIGATAIYTATLTPVRVGRFNSGGGLDGYVHDYRIVKGTAVYTSNFTPPTEPLEAITNTELLFMSKSHYGYADKSTNGHEIQLNGPDQGTNIQTKPFVPYDYAPWSSRYGGSVYIDGASAMTAANSSDWDLSTNDWTIECWFLPIGSANYTIVSKYAAEPDYGWYLWINSGHTIQFFHTTDGTNSTLAIHGWQYTNYVDRTWNHLALVRNGNDLDLYINGKGQTTIDVTGKDYYHSSVPLTIGNLHSTLGGNYNFEGNIADLRITNGTAQYTADFTPPTEPISLSSAKLLMNNKSDANIYDAAAAFSLVPEGDIQSSSSVVKWSGSSSVYGQNSGTHQGILIAEGESYRDFFTFTGREYTIEGWIRNIGYGDQVYFGSGGGAGSWSNTNGHHQLLFLSSGNLYYQYNKGSNGVQSIGPYAASTYLPTGTWKHMAITFDGTTHRLLVDGTQLGSSTTSMASVTGGTWNVRFGHPSSTGYELNAYMQDWRIIADRCLYTGSYTVPTAEFEL